ncbi:MAG: pyridoxal phosphate-dependent aminotransferase [Candidatus Limnocylindrales bacterium]
MTPTPFTYTAPDAPASYAWEATDEAVAARYGLPIERIVRFDLNTAPTPPALIADLLAAGRFETTLSEYPPADYRRLTEAAADRFGVATDEVLIGAGADEVLDIIGKVFLPPGSRAVVPIPTYAMYRVLTEQRGATVVPVRRLAAALGHGLDVPAVRAAARDAAVVWLCSPNNPTALPEADGVIEGLLAEILADAQADGREAPVVVLDEAYAEFVGRSLLALRTDYPRLIVVRTASKAYALAGLRVGFALALPAVIATLNPFRSPASVSTVSVTLVTAALRDDRVAAANVERVERERERLRSELTAAGWSVGPSVTNFLLVDLGSTERAGATAEGLLRHGLVPRTFGAGHPLADHLRLTVRDTDENDRLIAAARAIETEAGADA